ncbi:hypothetical protein ACFZDP_48975 [Streptomyces mirabilis]
MIYVILPEEPPDVTESVAAALLLLLHAISADPNQPHTGLELL